MLLRWVHERQAGHPVRSSQLVRYVPAMHRPPQAAVRVPVVLGSTLSWMRPLTDTPHSRGTANRARTVPCGQPTRGQCSTAHLAACRRHHIVSITLAVVAPSRLRTIAASARGPTAAAPPSAMAATTAAVATAAATTSPAGARCTSAAIGEGRIGVIVRHATGFACGVCLHTLAVGTTYRACTYGSSPPPAVERSYPLGQRT